MKIEQVKKIAQDIGLSPSKMRGQNFLLDEDIAKKIVEDAGVDENSKVLEIGPGFGVLTKELLASSCQLLAVELDERGYSYLKREYGKNKNLQLVNQDILRFRNEEIGRKLGENYQVVANIPYAITGPIIRKFMSYEPKPTSLTLMVQKEVGERITAKPGEMSILAISVQFYADAKILFEVPKEKFWPIPKVDSVVIQIKLHSQEINKSKNQENNFTDERFFQIVKFGFSAKRKKMINNLAAGLRMEPKELHPIFEKLHLNLNARAQDLSVEEWIALSNTFPQP